MDAYTHYILHWIIMIWKASGHCFQRQNRKLKEKRKPNERSSKRRKKKRKRSTDTRFIYTCKLRYVVFIFYYSCNFIAAVVVVVALMHLRYVMMLQSLASVEIEEIAFWSRRKRRSAKRLAKHMPFLNISFWWWSVNM